MNKFKEMLLNGQKPLGTFVDTASTYVVECLGRTGFDYIIIDNEHSPVEAETTAELVRAAELAGLTPFARVRDIQRSAILKLLDVGTQGLIIPNVSSVEDVEKVVSYCKYSPIGNRGFCPSGKDGWGYDLEFFSATICRLLTPSLLTRISGTNCLINTKPLCSKHLMS